MRTKESVYIRKELNSHRICLEHQYCRRDVMWKRSITWKGPARSRHFYLEIGSNVHEQCVTRCPVSRLVHSPGRPASVITWKISTRDPGITILGSQLTGLADWYGCHIIAKLILTFTRAPGPQGREFDMAAILEDREKLEMIDLPFSQYPPLLFFKASTQHERKKGREICFIFWYIWTISSFIVWLNVYK